MFSSVLPRANENQTSCLGALASQHTHKNLVYGLAHRESPIAQWLEHPSGISKVMGSTPVGGSEKFFSLFIRLDNIFFIIYTLSKSSFHLSFNYIYHFDIFEPCS